MTLSSTLKALSVGVGASLLLASGAHAQLDSALQEAKSATAAAAAAQAQIDELDDQASSAVRDYGAVIQQSDNLRLQVDQQDVVLASQRRELASVRRQLASVEEAKQGVIPMMLRMIVALEDSVAADIPFRETERKARVEDIKQMMADPDVSPAEQYRRILNAYEIETNYGYQVESYEGAHPSKPGNVVNFVRFGRSSWVYMSKDESEMATYDLASNEWRPVTGADAISMRQAIRVANEEAAPAIVYAPVIKR
jgi:hypothetical protein